MVIRYLIIFFLVFGGQYLSAREMKDCFKDAPDNIFPLLTHNNRLDMLDFLDSNMDAVVKNVYGESSQLLVMRSNYMKLRSSSSLDMEMMMLPYKNDTLLCLVKTYYVPESESELLFFEAATWKPVQRENLIAIPLLKDFLLCPADCSKEVWNRAVARMDIPMLGASLDEKSLEVRFKLRVDGGFTDKQEELKPFLKDEIVMKWNGRRFVRR